MSLINVLAISVGLAMDAFAVSICKGLSLKKFNTWYMLLVAFLFGFFQFAMPLIGFLISKNFQGYIEKYDHYIAFFLLAFLGVKMIIEATKKEDIKDKKNIYFETKNNDKKQDAKNMNLGETKQDSLEDKIDFKELLLLAFATSIDALAVGVTFSLFNLNVFLVSGIIGIITFALCCLGVLIGNFFGAKYKKTAEIAGGIILMLIGLKILIEGIISV